MAAIRRIPAARGRGVAWFGLALCAGALAVANGAEHLFGLVPCELCLMERRPYYVGAAIALLALALPAMLVRTRRAAGWLILLCLIAAAGAAGVHVGVEQHWWPSPMPECSAPDLGGLTAAERFARMPVRPSKPCEDPDYLVPGVPVSMTQANLIYALAGASIVAMFLFRTTRKRSR